MAPIEAWLVFLSVCLGVSLSLSQSLHLPLSANVRIGGGIEVSSIVGGIEDMS